MNDTAAQGNNDGTVKSRPVECHRRLALELKGHRPLEQLGTESLALRRQDAWSSLLAPLEDQLGRIGAIIDVPRHIDPAPGLAQCTVFNGVGGELMNGEREGLGRFRLKTHGRAGNAKLLALVGVIAE